MKLADLPTPQLVEGGSLRIAGLCERYPFSNCAGIPDQWERLRPFLEVFPGAEPGVSYGVCCSTENPGLLDYYCGVPTTPADEVPAGLTLVEVPAQHYAVFMFGGHISTIQAAIQTICTEWMPASGRKAGHGPSLERYTAAFDPFTGAGGYEIWIPVEPGSEV